MNTRECLTPHLLNFHGTLCMSRNLFDFHTLQIGSTARSWNRYLSSYADPRVVSAEMKREKRQSARRGRCENTRWPDCESTYSHCTKSGVERGCFGQISEATKSDEEIPMKTLRIILGYEDQ